MQFTSVTAALLTLATLATAAPKPVLENRDVYGPCSAFGTNCQTQEQAFCDPFTGMTSVCHSFGTHCWIRYTLEPCAAPTPAPTKRSEEAELTKRNDFDDCVAFGDKCAVDDNVFCENGWTRICHHLPFTGKCLISYGLLSC